MAHVKTFKDLIAWQKAMALAQEIYLQTRKMPEGERFGLTIQMRRAAVSIPSNIAEGFGRQSRPELLRYLRIARGSLNELMTQHEIAVNLKMLNQEPRLLEIMVETDRVLQALLNSLQRRSS